MNRKFKRTEFIWDRNLSYHYKCLYCHFWPIYWILANPELLKDDYVCVIDARHMKTAVAHNAVFEPFLFREYGFSGECFFLQFEDFLEIAFNLYLAQRVDQNIRLFPKPFVLFKFSENWGYSHCEMTLHHCTDLDRNLSDFMGCFCLVYRLLLIIGILCCCSTGYFIRRRVHPYPPRERPDFNVAFTRQPIISPGNLSLCLCLAYMHYVVSFPVCILSLCVGRIASWLSQLWRLRDCSHFHRLPSADPPRSRDCSVFSPAVPLQTAPSFLWSGHARHAEEITDPQHSDFFLLYLWGERKE